MVESEISKKLIRLIRQTNKLVSDVSRDTKALRDTLVELQSQKEGHEGEDKTDKTDKPA